MISNIVSVHALHNGWSITVELLFDVRSLSAFFPLRDADGDVLPVLVRGGCDSRSKSADEAARRALSEFGSFVLSPAELELEAVVGAASELLSLEGKSALDVDGDDACRGAMNESCTRS